MKVGFFQHHLCIRGTTVAMFDYAFANQTVSGNQSIIFYNPRHPANDPDVIKKFKSVFIVVEVSNINDVDEHILNRGISFLYIIKAGTKSNDISKHVPTLIHSVFKWDPHGVYACVSRSIAETNKGEWLPHIINPLPYAGGNEYRQSLGIPLDAIVYGRYGGMETFSIDYVKECIVEEIHKLKNVYFLFCNTNKFIEHPRVIHVNKLVTEKEKGTFIDACNYMIHARMDGETFGLAVAEFAMGGKLVITSPAVVGQDNEHIHHLGNKTLIYTDKNQLRNVLQKTSKEVIKPAFGPLSYDNFTPENVMKVFWNLLIKREGFEIEEYPVTSFTETGGKAIIINLCKNNKHVRNVLGLDKYFEEICIMESDPVVEFRLRSKLTDDKYMIVDISTSGDPTKLIKVDRFQYLLDHIVEEECNSAPEDPQLKLLSIFTDKSQTSQEINKITTSVKRIEKTKNTPICIHCLSNV